MNNITYMTNNKLPDLLWLYIKGLVAKSCHSECNGRPSIISKKKLAIGKHCFFTYIIYNVYEIQ